MTRYIFVTGGVVSSLGKGLAAASLASLLQARGYKVRLKKFDPYINIDPGTMNPSQHGEVFVTEDGAETDLDLGHYERFTGVSCRRTDSVSSGQIYSSVIQKERQGDYLGGTVQVVPHITNEIKSRITDGVDPDTDFVFCEIGGTIGDIEGLPFLEALRQFINENRSTSLLMHLTLVPYIAAAGELKTKPSQHSVKELLRDGIQPDILLCRCEHDLPEEARKKLALFCNIKPERVLEARDLDSIYKVPLALFNEGLDGEVLKFFHMPYEKNVDLSHWKSVVHAIENPLKAVTIGLVAKYLEVKDAYKSVIEALTHGGIANQTQVKVRWINAEDLETAENAEGLPPESLDPHLGGLDGILVPGGYGVRGVEGKIAAIRYAREKNIPFMGICLGMQLAVIESLRHKAGMPKAHSTEFGPTDVPAIALMQEWIHDDGAVKKASDQDLGGSMRLGFQACQIKPGTLAAKIYGVKSIRERHRHRYEVNKIYSEDIKKSGLYITGSGSYNDLPEIVERKDHPWFFCMQYHPEFGSRPFCPHPAFKSFISATLSTS